MVYILTKTTAFGGGADPETDVLCVGTIAECKKKFKEKVKEAEESDFDVNVSGNEAGIVDQYEDSLVILKIHGYTKR